MRELVEFATAHNLTVSSCESLTAGLFAAQIASVPGASAVLAGGLVTYSNEMKERLAHVPAEIIAEYGAVSKECARAMALGAREATETDYCVSFTGNAGPDVMEDKPAGLVYCAVTSVNRVMVFEFQYNDLKRNEVRERVCADMGAHLLSIMKEDMNGG